MLILIDGYNLLNATGITGDIPGRTELERSRTALLNFLESVLDEEEADRTTVVFDSTDPPPGLPQLVKHGRLTVRFATDFVSADAMIEYLVRTCSAPRSLTVVSSDHQVQKSARRKKSRAVDSDVWYVERIRNRHLTRTDAAGESSEWKPKTPLSPEEVDWWLEEFGGEPAFRDMIDEAEQIIQDEHHRETAAIKTERERLESRRNGSPPPKIEDLKPGLSDISNPFPPGYGEDIDPDATF